MDVENGKYDDIGDEPILLEKEIEYLIILPTEKFCLVLVLSLTGFWSTIASPIFFPMITVLSNYFHESDSVMNLVVVVYLIFQGIVPTITLNLADSLGKRPVIIACLIIYIGACIGIAVSNKFWLLIFLRCIQAGGIAPVIAVNSGVGGDITTRAERGGFVGVLGGLQLVGNAFGALIGTGIISRFDWRAVFYFLAIGSGATLVIVFICLPETSRLIVGNGSVKPKSIFNTAPILFLPSVKKRLTNDTSTLVEKEKFSILAAYKIMRSRVVLLTLLASGFQFASWTMVLTSISVTLDRKYHYSIVHIGLVYLPQGICSLLSSVATGKFLNYYYKRAKRQHDEKYADMKASERPKLNIYITRLMVLFPGVSLMCSGLLIFGWCLQKQQSVVSIIISSSMISIAASCFISAGTTLLVDIYPTKGSTLTSCMNLFRCLLAAAGTGALSSMSDALGDGGTYTLMAGFCLVTFTIQTWFVYLHND